MTISRIAVRGDEVRMRVDKFLARRYPDFSRSFFKHALTRGLVLVNGRIASPKNLLKKGDIISLDISGLERNRETAKFSHPPEPQDIPLDVLYEDKHIIVINKQAGLVVHPACGNTSGTLVNALVKRYPEMGSLCPDNPQRPGIVHRLDKMTSGVLVIARSSSALAHLSSQFADKKVLKIYWAVTYGVLLTQQGVITESIGRKRTDRKKMAVVHRHGKQAITRFRVLERFGKYSLMEIIPATGRTHQIRVHMAHRGLPIAGDRDYGHAPVPAGVSISRQMLHARFLHLRHPYTHEKMCFEAPLAEDISTFIAFLRKSNN